MLKKNMLVFAATAVFVSTSAAFAYEAPENKIGDRYPFLEQTYKPNVSSRSAGKSMKSARVSHHKRKTHSKKM